MYSQVPYPSMFYRLTKVVIGVLPLSVLGIVQQGHSNRYSWYSHDCTKFHWDDTISLIQWLLYCY